MLAARIARQDEPDAPWATRAGRGATRPRFRHPPMKLAEAQEQFRHAAGGQYEIEREIGRGGMAVVYLARDRKHERSVAVKVLKPHIGAALGAERFLREILLTAKLHHPHIL